MSNEHVVSTDGNVEHPEDLCTGTIGVQPCAEDGQLKALLRHVENSGFPGRLAPPDTISCDEYCLELHTFDLATLPKDLKEFAVSLIRSFQSVIDRSIAAGRVTLEIRREQQELYQDLRDLYAQGNANALNFFVHEFNRCSPNLVLSMKEERDLCEELNAGLHTGGWDSVYSIAVINRETGEPIELNNVAFR